MFSSLLIQEVEQPGCKILSITFKQKEKHSMPIQISFSNRIDTWKSMVYHVSISCNHRTPSKVICPWIGYRSVRPLNTFVLLEIQKTFAFHTTFSTTYGQKCPNWVSIDLSTVLLTDIYLLETISSLSELHGNIAITIMFFLFLTKRCELI